MSSDVPYSCVERSIVLSDGIRLSFAEHWLGHRPPSGSLAFIPILCIHGWQDNGNSFLPLIHAFRERAALKQSPPHPNAAALSLLYDSVPNRSKFPALSPLVAPICFVCVDLTGHGRSGHLPLSAFYSYPTYTLHCAELTRKHLGWSKFHIIAHSMGGAVGVFLAASMKANILSLTTLDSATIWVYPAKMGPPFMSQLIERRLDSIEKPIERRQLSSLKEAVEKYRIRNPFITQKAVELLVKRALIPVSQAANNVNISSSEEFSSPEPLGSGPFQFRHDIRLNNPPSTIYLEESVTPFLAQINAPVLFFLARREERMRQEELAKKKEIAQKTQANTNSSSTAGNDENPVNPEENPSDSINSSQPTAQIGKTPQFSIPKEFLPFKKRFSSMKNIQIYSITGDHHFHMDSIENSIDLIWNWIHSHTILGSGKGKL